MNFSSLTDDVLFHLVKFVDPVDQFNLLLSGILKGFENVNEGIDLRHRYSEHLIAVKCERLSHCYLFRINDVGIKLGPCRDRTCQLEIR
jgi:hypothetical protein